MKTSQKQDATPFVPQSRSLHTLKKHALSCQGCDLFKNATQTVFGEGESEARLMLVGEQPGDQEDLAGSPFVGPSGKLLRRALSKAGVPDNGIFITNAVKHFRWHMVGKRRMGDKPTLQQIRACKPWLEAEIEAVQPRVIVALGTTAGVALFERAVSIQHDGYHFVGGEDGEPFLLLLQHPSALLRLRSGIDRDQAISEWTSWLKQAWDRAELWPPTNPERPFGLDADSVAPHPST